MVNKLNNLFGKKEVHGSDLKDKRLAVKAERCPQNHSCPSVKVCPVDALSQEGYKAPVVDMSKCIKCGKCIKFCPMRALVLE